MLPLVQKIAGNLDSAGLLQATVTEVIDPAAAEAQIRSYLAATVARSDYRTAMIAAGRMAHTYLRSGRSAAALAFADQAVSYAQQAAVGSWTKLGTEVQRLQMLSETGDPGSVLPEVQRLRNLMEALRSDSGEDEAARPWDVREALLSIDRSVRIELEQWAEALAVNAEIIASLRDRQAPASQIARARMNDYGPILKLDRGVSQARDLLLDCRQAFQDAHDLQMLGTTYGALADVEEKLGHVENAVRLAHDALRFGYAAGDIGAIRDVYHNLGNYLAKDNEPISALACHLGAALIKTLIDARDTGRSLRAASVDLYVFGKAVEPPTDIADLSSRIGSFPGTDPAALIARLSPDPETAERTLQDLIARARRLAGSPPEDGTPS